MTESLKRFVMKIKESELIHASELWPLVFAAHSARMTTEERMNKAGWFDGDVVFDRDLGKYFIWQKDCWYRCE
jgi:hypothetical protein